MKLTESGTFIIYYKSYPTTIMTHFSSFEIEGIFKVQDGAKYVRVVIINPGLSRCDDNTCFNLRLGT